MMTVWLGIFGISDNSPKYTSTNAQCMMLPFVIAWIVKHEEDL